MNESRENGLPGASSESAIRAAAYSARWRAVAALLSFVSGASLIVLLWLVFFSASPITNPLRLIRLATAFCLLPALALGLLRWASSATVAVEGAVLVVEQRHRRLEVPLASIAAIEPWRLPLPGPGLVLRLGSGARLDEGLQIDDPSSLLEALAAVGAPLELLEVGHDPVVVYARNRSAVVPRSALRLLIKFPIFGLVPTLPLFRVHQIIAYGGLWGEYYQYGLGQYLLGFAIYWASLTIQLMLYAAALRVPVEILNVAAVFFAPNRAGDVRRVTHKISTILFYAAVPIVLILRFIPW